MWTPSSRTRSERHRGAILGALVLVGLAAGGCPFTPRKAPPPCTPGVDPGCNTPPDIRPPLTPEIAMENIRNSLRKRGLDGPNVIPYYEQALADGFFYVPDADAEAASSPCGSVPFFENWDRFREVQFMQDILEVGFPDIPDTVELTYLRMEEADPFPENDRTRYNVDYVLSLVFHPPDSTDRKVECFGAVAVWDFNGGDRSDWRLLRWEDTAPLQNVSCPGGTYGNTLGRLKAEVGRCP